MNTDTTEREMLESMLWGRFSFSQDDCGAIAAAVLAKGFRRQPQEVTDAMVERLASESLIAAADARAEKAEKECARLREAAYGLVEVLDRTIAPDGDGPVVISSHNDELIEMLCSRIKNVRAAISGAGEPGAVPK